ncbi:MAG TPA: hypothetical protein VE287_01510 [Actinopolymorphaceae bacterium]|nr:hypothetical protein [Actinopolymorphaceae bacterium]
MSDTFRSVPVAGASFRTVAGALGVGVVVFLAGPAWADSTGDVNATVDVSGGPLSISTPDAIELGSTAVGMDVGGQLGGVTVLDRRGATSATWTATVTSTAYTTGGGASSETIPASDVDYWSGPATDTEGTATFTPGQATDDDAVPLDVAETAFSEGSGDGGNSASWDPTITVHIPATAVAGSYSGTVTHNVS